MVHYGMTKSAQLAVARGMAQQTKGTGVTVNSVLPGPTRAAAIADFLKSVSSNPEAHAEEHEAEFFTKHRSSSLLQRMIEPQEGRQPGGLCRQPAVGGDQRGVAEGRGRIGHDDRVDQQHRVRLPLWGRCRRHPGSATVGGALLTVGLLPLVRQPSRRSPPPRGEAFSA
jgi:hypothetical protein